MKHLVGLLNLLKSEFVLLLDRIRIAKNISCKLGIIARVRGVSRFGRLIRMIVIHIVSVGISVIAWVFGVTQVLL